MPKKRPNPPPYPPRDIALWEDPDFPPNDSSLYHTDIPDGYSIEWLRPGKIVGKGEKPQLIVDGTSKLDVNQGALGDCWFLAALTALSENKKLLHRVVPKDQSFQNNYHGLFKFKFWEYGRWVEVQVDDRLPCYVDKEKGTIKLIYVYSESKKEFWTALIEKAYAKFKGGCYLNLHGGVSSEAMVDFTGGVVERFVLRKDTPEDLLEHMLKAKKRFSLMTCSIDSDKQWEELNGLITTHAYTITDVKMVDIPGEGKLPMVRCRNPWGDGHEWTGPWSDGSQEWKSIDPEQREKIGLRFRRDGEFWMSFEDFTEKFQHLEICFLGPDKMIAGDGIESWKSIEIHGSWKNGVNAGGCRNYPTTFLTNPKYRFTIKELADEDGDGLALVIISLIQKRKKDSMSGDKDEVFIGYVVFKLGSMAYGPLVLPYEDTASRGLPQGSVAYSPVVARTPNYTNRWEVTSYHKLAPGNYVIVPSTFKPGEEADFMLRIFTENKAEGVIS